MTDIKRVVVAGTGFGRIYIEALTSERLAPLRQQQHPFELAGIMGRGSETSRSIAKQYGVPLYTEAEQILQRASQVLVALQKDATDRQLNLSDEAFAELLGADAEPTTGVRCLQRALLGTGALLGAILEAGPFPWAAAAFGALVLVAGPGASRHVATGEAAQAEAVRDGFQFVDDN